MGNDEKGQIRTPECEIFGVPKRYAESEKEWLARTPPGLATTYLKNGWSLFPISKTGKTPLTEALPHGRWKPYQYHQPTRDEVGAWFTDYSEWPGGDGLNIAIATGIGGLCVVDIDVPEIPPELKVLNTTTVQTRRGHHLYFTHHGQPALKSARLKLFGLDMEFKALGQYVVAPPSILMNTDGTILHEYRFHVPVSSIKPLPPSILQHLGEHTLSPDHTARPFNGTTRHCIARLMNHDVVPVGERDTVLWVLYWRLLVAGAKKQFAQDTVQHLNERFAKPLSRRDVDRFIFNGSHEYRLGCEGTIDRLPWIEKECCPGCPENRRKTKLALEKLGIDVAIKTASKDLSLIATLIWQAKLNAKGEQTSVSALAKASGLAENTVRAAMERARAKGFWDE